MDVMFKLILCCLLCHVGEFHKRNCLTFCQLLVLVSQRLALVRWEWSKALATLELPFWMTWKKHLTPKQSVMVVVSLQTRPWQGGSTLCLLFAV